MNLTFLYSLIENSIQIQFSEVLCRLTLSRFLFFFLSDFPLMHVDHSDHRAPYTHSDHCRPARIEIDIADRFPADGFDTFSCSYCEAQKMAFNYKPPATPPPKADLNFQSQFHSVQSSVTLLRSGCLHYCKGVTANSGRIDLLH